MTLTEWSLNDVLCHWGVEHLCSLLKALDSIELFPPSQSWEWDECCLLKTSNASTIIVIPCEPLTSLQNAGSSPESVSEWNDFLTFDPILPFSSLLKHLWINSSHSCLEGTQITNAFCPSSSLSPYVPKYLSSFLHHCTYSSAFQKELLTLCSWSLCLRFCLWILSN